MAQIQSGPKLRAVNQHGHVSERPLNPKALTEIYRNLAQRAGLPDYLVRGLTTFREGRGCSRSSQVG